MNKIVDLVSGLEIARFFGASLNECIDYANNNCVGEWIVLHELHECVSCSNLIGYGLQCAWCASGDLPGYWIVYIEEKDDYEVWVRRESERDVIEAHEGVYCVEWYFDSEDANKALGW